MTAKELIKELEKHNPDMEVVYGKNEWHEMNILLEDDNNGMQKSVIVIDE